MGKKRNIMVIDFETIGSDPQICDPIQLSALVINSNKLEIIPDSEFDINIKPNNIDKENYLELNEEGVNFHAKLYNKSPQEMIEIWKNGVDEKSAIHSFVSYIKKWNPKNNSSWNSTLWAGANPQYDIDIFKRYCSKYNIPTKNLFWWRDTINLQFWAWSWLQWREDEPDNYQMDTLREWFSIESQGQAHNSLVDVKEEAGLIIRFLRLFKYYSQKVSWRKE